MTLDQFIKANGISQDDLIAAALAMDGDRSETVVLRLHRDDFDREITDDEWDQATNDLLNLEGYARDIYASLED